MSDKSKYRPMTRSQSVIASALFLVVLFFLLLLTAVGKELLCWVNENDGLASWTQAIGSIFAILGGAYYVRYQFNLQERSKREAASGLLMEFFVQLSFLKNSVEDICNPINEETNKVDVKSFSCLIFFFEELLNHLNSIRKEDLSAEWSTIILNSIISLKILLSELYKTEEFSKKYLDEVDEKIKSKLFVDYLLGCEKIERRFYQIMKIKVMVDRYNESDSIDNRNNKLKEYFKNLIIEND